MIEAGGGLRFPSKALQVRFRRPLAESNDFKSDGAIETFLPRTKNDALSAAADFLQQFVITEISQHAAECARLSVCGGVRSLSSPRLHPRASARWPVLENAVPGKVPSVRRRKFSLRTCRKRLIAVFIYTEPAAIALGPQCEIIHLREVTRATQKLNGAARLRRRLVLTTVWAISSRNSAR